MTDRRTNKRAPLFLGLLLAFGVGGAVLWSTSRSPVESPANGPAESDPWAEFARKRLKEIRTEQESLEKFVGAGKILSKYRTLRNRVRGTKWEGRASRQEADFRRTVEAAADRELDRIREAEKPLREGKVDAKILALYGTFPRQFLRITPSGKVVEDEIRTFRGRIRTRFIEDRRKLEAHLKEWQLEEARQVFAGMKSYSPEELRGDVEELGETIEEMERVHSARMRRDVTDRYFPVDQAFRAAMKRRDEASAIGAILKFFRRDWSADERPFVFLRSLDYAGLIRLVETGRWEEIVRITGVEPEDLPETITAVSAIIDLRAAALVALFRARAEAGLAFAVRSGKAEEYGFQLARGTRGFLSRREGRTWLVVGEDRLIPVAGLTSFPTVDMVQLGERGWNEDRGVAGKEFADSPWGQMAAGLLFHFSGSVVDFARSRRHLERARELGMKGVNVYLSALSISQSDRQEHRLREEIERINKWISRHRYEDAWVSLDTLLRESEHPFITSQRGELDRKLAAVNARRTVLQKLSVDFRAPVTYTTSGQLRVKYDFSSPKQLEAFGTLEKAGGHPLRGRWKWRDGVMESGTFPSAMRWKMKMKGDLDISLDLTPLEEPQNIVIDLFTRSGGKKHYAVVFGFDWVGKANGDPENIEESRNGMPSTCVLKYPVDVLLRDRELPETWEKWKERLVGGPVQDVRLVRDTAHYVRILREGARISLHVDGKLAWEGEDEEYREGFLLFYSDCRTRFDNLRIRFDAPK